MDVYHTYMLLDNKRVILLFSLYAQSLRLSLYDQSNNWVVCRASEDAKCNFQPKEN